jgi:uncharacterized protein (TIGR04255 family)
VTNPEARLWFIGRDKSSLIQVQHDRFLFNWRKENAKDSYPRYEDFVRPAFEKEFVRFVRFLEQQKLAAPDIVQCEVSYVNHIPKGEGWNVADDWKKVFTRFADAPRRDFLPAPESLRLSANFIIPERRGRLRISANPAIRQNDQAEVIALNLTARGRPESASTASVLAWLDMGREWVVRGFADFTSDEMHAIWERQT